MVILGDSVARQLFSNSDLLGQTILRIAVNLKLADQDSLPPHSTDITETVSLQNALTCVWVRSS